MANAAADEWKRKIFEMIANRDEAVNQRNELNLRIPKMNADIKSAVDGYYALTGEKLFPDKPMHTPVLDLVEKLLEKHHKLHLSEIMRLLEEEFQTTARPQTVSSGLTRFHNQNKRFRRVGKNTYELLKR